MREFQGKEHFSLVFYLANWSIAVYDNANVLVWDHSAGRGGRIYRGLSSF